MMPKSHTDTSDARGVSSSAMNLEADTIMTNDIWYYDALIHRFVVISNEHPYCLYA